MTHEKQAAQAALAQPKKRLSNKNFLKAQAKQLAQGQRRLSFGVLPSAQSASHKKEVPEVMEIPAVEVPRPLPVPPVVTIQTAGNLKAYYQQQGKPLPSVEEINDYLKRKPASKSLYDLLIKNHRQAVVPANAQLEVAELAHIDLVSNLRYAGPLVLTYSGSRLVLGFGGDSLEKILRFFKIPAFRKIFEIPNQRPGLPALFDMGAFTKFLEKFSYSFQNCQCKPSIMLPVTHLPRGTFRQGMELMVPELREVTAAQGQGFRIGDYLHPQYEYQAVDLKNRDLADLLSLFLDSPYLRRLFSEEDRPSSEESRGQYFRVAKFFEFLRSLGYEIDMMTQVFQTSQRVDWRGVDLCEASLYGDAKYNIFVEKPPKSQSAKEEYLEQEGARIDSLDLQACQHCYALPYMRVFLRMGYVHLSLDAIHDGNSGNMRSGSLQGAISYRSRGLLDDFSSMAVLCHAMDEEEAAELALLPLPSREDRLAADSQPAITTTPALASSLPLQEASPFSLAPQAVFGVGVSPVALFSSSSESEVSPPPMKRQRTEEGEEAYCEAVAAAHPIPFGANALNSPTKRKIAKPKMPSHSPEGQGRENRPPRVSQLSFLGEAEGVSTSSVATASCSSL